MIKVVNKSILQAPINALICHQVNCMGKFSSGVAGVIRDYFIGAYVNYIKKYNETTDKASLLGKIQIIKPKEKHNICNMFAQYYYGYDGKRYTNYDAFITCLEEIKKKVPTSTPLAFPYNIGCDRGGADWKIISNLIEIILGEKFDITFYKI